LNNVFADGICIGKQAAVAAVAGGAVEVGVAGVAGAGDAFAGVVVADVLLGESLFEELLESQPVMAKMHKNPSGAIALNALNRYPIATCS
jgi:sugar/nucleoside kinase (ribokinase family)